MKALPEPGRARAPRRISVQIAQENVYPRRRILATATVNATMLMAPAPAILVILELPVETRALEVPAPTRALGMAHARTERGGSGSCSCDNGWYGTSCGNECPGGASNPCSGHGACSNETGACTCVSPSTTRWTGAACNECDKGFYGPNCAKCPDCGDGSRNDGTSGDGACTCNSGVWGSHCGS